MLTTVPAILDRTSRAIIFRGLLDYYPGAAAASWRELV